ncbi:hypothetical protein SAMN05216355_10354 [Actinomyces ruminicola]|uniref:Uncharacterized protein n=1 Tax=Actinomyces ruminicola TaxID=332524 RepID=A0A1H0B3W7_9ACTO|nr:hypothetical protein [Actinomyces ruminicola]SDN40053.1 hypothetical protein SAMN05216355_10354 [Actinomyces ruminicola]
MSTENTADEREPEDRVPPAPGSEPAAGEHAAAPAPAPAPAAGETAMASPEPTPTPATEETTASAAEPRAPEPASFKSRAEDDILLDGSSVVGRPKSRAAAHWAGVLVWVIALPLAWFLLHDAAATAVDGATPLRFGVSVLALVELGIAAAALAVALWTASRSSLGSFVVGAASVLVGLPFLLAPAAMNDAIGPLLDRLTAHSQLGASLSAYWWADAISGKFIAFGLFMIMVGVVSHRARRAGRREQEIIDQGRRTV